MKIHRGLQDLRQFEKPVITFGSFDGIHGGHKVILEQVVKTAKKLQKESLVISFDPHPREVIYPKDQTLRLISTIEEKIKNFEDLGIDHFVLIPFKIEFSQIAPKEYIEKVIIKKFDPCHVVIGYDHRFGLNRAGGYELLQEYGQKHNFIVEVIEEQKCNDINISSTKIRNALEKGYVALANSLLGYPYELTGKVVQGDRLGRKLGFPTANLSLAHAKKLVPKNGVYAVKCLVDDQSHVGMLYIGNRSTVTDNDVRNIEVNIFDFDNDLYGKEVTVQFHQRIRGDQKFKNVTNLKQAIALDKNAVKSWFRKQSEKTKEDLATIAILNYNGQEMLESFLPMVLYSSSKQVATAVIDNHSTDESIHYIKEWHPECELIILDKNYGFAEGYNKGISELKTKYTVLLNSDVLVSEYWLDPILELMEGDETIAACQPKIKSLEEKNKFEYAGAAGGMMDRMGYPFCRGRIFDEIEEDNGQYDDRIDVFWTSGAAMVIRTDLYKKFNGLDPDYFAHQEEIDLCWRLKNAGYRLCYVPKSVVFHLGGGTLEYSNPKKTFLNYRNNLSTLFKNQSRGSLIWVMLQRLVFDLGSSFVFLIRGELKTFGSIWKAYIAFIILIPSLINRRWQMRKTVQRFRIGPVDKSGRLHLNLPWNYFVKGKKTFSELSNEILF